MARITQHTLSDEVLGSAMVLFWEKGYLGTSVGDLVERTGLHRSAIYGGFGSKQRLFEALLARFQAQVTDAMLAPLRAEGASLEALEAFFGQFLDWVDLPTSHLGCLMTLAAVEVAPHEPQVRLIVEEYLGGVRGAFEAALERARQAGQVRQDVCPAGSADYLLGALLGLMTLARSPAPRSSLTHYLRGVLGALAALRVPHPQEEPHHE